MSNQGTSDVTRIVSALIAAMIGGVFSWKTPSSVVVERMNPHYGLRLVAQGSAGVGWSQPKTVGLLERRAIEVARALAHAAAFPSNRVLMIVERSGRVQCTVVSRSFALLASLLVVACHPPKRHAPIPAVVAAVELAPSAVVAGDSSGHGAVDLGDEVLATEAEAIVSDRVLRRAAEQGGLDHVPELAGDGGVDHAVRTLRAASSAHRRGKSLVLDVRVELADPVLAKNACDSIVHAYLDERLERKIVTAQDKLARLSDQLDAYDAGDAPASLREEIRQQEAAARSRERDAWLQSPCEIVRR